MMPFAAAGVNKTPGLVDLPQSYQPPAPVMQDTTLMGAMLAQGVPLNATSNINVSSGYGTPGAAPPPGTRRVPVVSPFGSYAVQSAPDVDTAGGAGGATVTTFDDLAGRLTSGDSLSRATSAIATSSAVALTSPTRRLNSTHGPAADQV